MVFALDIDETNPYSLHSDSGEEKTIFLLGAIDGVLLSAIEDTQTQFALNNSKETSVPDISINVHGKNVELVKFGLKGWERLKEKSGNDVQFKTQSYTFPRVGVRTGVHQECLRRLSKDVIAELAEEVIKLSALTKVQEKN